MSGLTPLPDRRDTDTRRAVSTVNILVASGSEALLPALIGRVRAIDPSRPLYVFSELPPDEVLWIPYHPARTFQENYACCRAALRGRRVRYSAVLFEPRTPYWRMRLIGFLLNPLGFLAFNENLDHWMLRPRSIPAMTRHVWWRLRNFVRWAVRERGWLPRLAQASFWAEAAGLAAALAKAVMPAATHPAQPVARPRGISVVVLVSGPRDLASVLAREFDTLPTEILTISGPHDLNPALGAARYAHLCVLPEENLLREGTLRTLYRSASQTPDGFAATITPDSFQSARPLLGGEDGAYVLAGRLGCTLYSTAKVESLGGFPQGHTSGRFAGIELGYRAWRRGWPTVQAGFVHQQQEEMPEAGDLRLLVRLVASPRIFLRMWRQALAAAGPAVVAVACRALAWIELSPAGDEPEERFLALCSGCVAVFPGTLRRGRPAVLVASPYLPFPLSHGGAVRIYNLMRRAAEHYDQILVAFVEELTPPPPEVLDLTSEIVLVRRVGSHLRRSTGRPDAVEEFDSPAYRAALRQTVRKWGPAIVQLEFTQMAQYAREAAPAKTILVEHDITYAFHEHLARHHDDWETRRQARLWRHFETRAWRQVDAVITMSEADRRLIAGAEAVSLPNGVDLHRFRPSGREPDPSRLLFAGPFQHLPNVLAIDFFLNEVWPLLANASPVLHLIAGRNYRSHLRPLRGVLSRPGIEVDEFVDDLRQAYERATLVIAPLQASAGTKIKVLEAMAAGKAIVATPSGVRGLEVTPGVDVLVASSAAAFAAAILELLRDAPRRKQIEGDARATAERLYGWDRIAQRQARLYRSLTPS